MTDFNARESRYWVGANGDPGNTTTTDAWKGLAHYIPARSPINTKPFVTNFNRGYGGLYAIDGVTRLAGEWTNLTLQEFLPTWRWIVTSSGTKLSPALYQADPYYQGDAYYGGTSLRFTGTLNAPNDVKLFQTSLPVAADTKLRLVYKRGQAGVPSAMQVAVAFTDAPSTFTYLDIGNSSSAGWSPIEWTLSAHAGKTIAVIGLRFANATAIAGYDMRVGRLAVSDGTPAPPGAPTNLQVLRQENVNADTLSLRLKWDHSTSPVHHYNVYTRWPDNSLVWVGATSNNYCFIPLAKRQAKEPTLNVQVEAVSPDFLSSATRASVSATFPAAPTLTGKLTGTVIGTIGSWNNSGETRDKVFDGDSSTAFDAQEADGVWAGLDLGAGNLRRITAVRYYPRLGTASRMTGGTFQGANTADFSDAVTLATIPTLPESGLYTTIAVSNPTLFRYARYAGPNGSHGNVAEVEFHGVGLAASPTGLAASMSKGVVSLRWAPSASAAAYRVKRSEVSGGPYSLIADTVTTANFTDSGLIVDRTYYYVVSTYNLAGEGADSAQVMVLDSYLQWARQNGWATGAPNSGFAEDADSNGTPNGVEYAVPEGLHVAGPAANTATVTAEVRIDAALSVVLQKSGDLVNWAPVSFTLSSDQSGVPAGFARFSVQDVGPSSPPRFYRLQFTR